MTTSKIFKRTEVRQRQLKTVGAYGRPGLTKEFVG